MLNLEAVQYTLAPLHANLAETGDKDLMSMGRELDNFIRGALEMSREFAGALQDQRQGTALGEQTAIALIRSDLAAEAKAHLSFTRKVAQSVEAIKDRASAYPVVQIAAQETRRQLDQMVEQEAALAKHGRR